MTVRIDAEGNVELVGACGHEDADELLRRLLEDRSGLVDLQSCDWAHTAVVQVLLAARVRIRGPASGPFLRDWVEPLLRNG